MPVDREVLLSPVVENRKANHRTLQSPTSQNPLHLLASNDDHLERALARAARAAASRRRSAALLPSRAGTAQSSPSPDLFARQHVLDLLQNCLKLASENKINQRNTWDLGLIDHLSELVRVEGDDDSETNFQKASCTLEAGVKIYSLRVDSAHSEAYKVLGGINRVGREEDDKENKIENDQSNVGEEEGMHKKDQARKLSPLSTLETSFDTLNIKKFDAAFTIDPLYHQTSAQFDEGGAKGLLLSNLGVYGACKVLFDSLETPGKLICESTPDLESIDISFVRDHFEQMLNCIPTINDISPTLKDIINQFNEDNKRAENAFNKPMESIVQDDVPDTNEVGYEPDVPGPWIGENDDHASVVNDELPYGHSDFVTQGEENDDHTSVEFIPDAGVDKIAGFLSLGLGLTSKVNAWAGPDHWKFQKVRGVHQNFDSTTEPKNAMPKKNKEHDASDLGFSMSLDKEMPDIFLPPKNPKTLLLPANRASCSITLPEDCHYQPESLVKLFLLPDVMCFGKKARSFETRSDSDPSGQFETWDNESTINDDFDDGIPNSDLEDLGDLISQPRQIRKIDIKYDKFSKQVDVHALKTALWDQILDVSNDKEKGIDSAVSFKQVFGCLRSESTAPSHEDISPHLSLICLLHLANEHSLRICSCPKLDELDIYVPL